MSFLNDIRNQPERTRKVMFVLATIITIMAAGTIWINKLRTDIFALMNPDPKDQQAFIEVQSATRSTPFSFIGKGIEKMQAAISGLFQQATPLPEQQRKDIGDAHLLPLPKSK